MKLIIRIAKTELATLFYSPIAWIILIVFAAQVGLDFMHILGNIVKIKAMGREITFSATAGLVLGSNGLYEVIQKTLYLYVPLLTMGLMSREYASGSIKLLFSSPITTTHIILGKYVSMLAYSFMLVFILFLPVITIFATIPNFDLSLILSGLLGLFLLISTYCAIGLFMSTLTSYQVVAAVATLSTLAFLQHVGGMWQEYEFLREITYWLSINGRASEMVSGLISSDGLIYFVSVISLFIALSIVKVHNERTKFSIIIKSLRYVAVLVVVITVGYISSRPSLMTFYDATRVDQMTITKSSQEVVNRLDGPLTITTYLNIFDGDFNIGHPKNVKKDQDRFKNYLRFKPEIEMEYVYYYSRPTDTTLLNSYPGLSIDEIAREVAYKKQFNPNRLIPVEDVPKEIDLEFEGYKFVRVIERGNGASSKLRIYSDMFRHPGETEISAALKKLVVDPVKVGMLVGHGERSTHKYGDKDYSTFASKRDFRNSMINQGFDIVPLDLTEVDEVPSELQILFIAEMRESLSAEENQKLDKYIADGGNLLIMTDINRQKVINPFLAKFGLRVKDGILVQPSPVYSADLVKAKASAEGADIVRGIFRSMMVNNYLAVSMPSVAALEQVEDRGYNVKKLLETSPTESWLELQTTDFINDTVKINSDSGEKLESHTTSYVLTRNINDKEQRIIVVGDADCISNAELMMDRQGYRSANFSIVPSMFRWLCYGEFPIYPTRDKNTDTDIVLSPINLPYIKIIYVVLIPVLIAIGALLLWLHRRKA